jgi:hypothetical protein
MVSSVEPASNVTEVNEVHSLNAPSPMDVMLAGIAMLVRPLLPKKASAPMDVTLFGIAMLVRPVSWKALRSIVARVDSASNVTDCSSVSQ